MRLHLSHPRVRARLWQLLLVVALTLGLWLLIANLQANLSARGVELGFGFLSGPAGFDISESLIAYSAESSYWVAYLVGIFNTLRVAVLGILVATLLGLFIAIGALSINPLVAALCRFYVEVLRNVPLLLQLFFWYLSLAALLPDNESPLGLGLGIFLSKGGVSFPWWVHGVWEVPELGPFGMVGGAVLSPEFLALLAGLSIYTSAFIAEVIRAGILSVPKGQSEAAKALGFSGWQQLRLIILPQALRVIIPPMTNQYLNLTKNSSLAVAIGYPELVSVATTTLNQTGHAVEAISLLMLVYLTLSLLTSWLMMRFEQSARLKERT